MFTLAELESSVSSARKKAGEAMRQRDEAKTPDEKTIAANRLSHWEAELESRMERLNRRRLEE